MLWGVLWMIHVWETILPKQYSTISMEDVGEEKRHAKTPAAKLKINKRRHFPPAG